MVFVCYNVWGDYVFVFYFFIYVIGGVFGGINWLC